MPKRGTVWRERGLSKTATVLLGNGDGTFQPQHTFAVGPQPFSVAVADLNRDGNPDLVVTDRIRGGTAVNVLLGNGDGTFKKQNPSPLALKPRGWRWRT